MLGQTTNIDPAIIKVRMINKRRKKGKLLTPGFKFQNRKSEAMMFSMR